MTTTPLPPLPRRHTYADDGEECFTDQMQAYATAARADLENRA